MRIDCSSNRITGCLLAAVTVLWLIPTLSLAGIPPLPKGLNIAANPNPLDPPNCHDDLGNPSVYPPCSSYGEWTAKWWEWALSIPLAVNPAFDPTGVNCGRGQAGPVWFMPPRFFTNPPIPFENWTCTIPRGVSLLLNASWNSASGAGLGDCRSPGWGNPPAGALPCDSKNETSVGDLLKANKAIVDLLVQNLGLPAGSIDGVLVQHLELYRFQSPVFSYKIPDDNILAFLFQFPIPAGTYAPAVSDGYWLLFKPLSPGTHKLQSKLQAVTTTLTLIVQ
jgi:hypothetical protein